MVIPYKDGELIVTAPNITPTVRRTVKYQNGFVQIIGSKHWHEYNHFFSANIIVGL